MSWLIIFAGFVVLIVLHELGHFTAAKAVGMRVERFALFFPPLICLRSCLLRMRAGRLAVCLATYQKSLPLSFRAGPSPSDLCASA